jgi:2',3'-cyclic-nucleotide 2'-phosphodiesterase (5'-nucleotidase family)
MNLMKYYAMTFGNHEFDLGGSADGHKALSEFVKNAEFPFLSSNVDFSADSLFDGLQNDEFTSTPEDGKIYNGMIKEINGEKVGVFGLTTEETPTISSTNHITFTNYITEAKAAVAAFEKEGVNKIVALTHLGYDDSKDFDNDIELAKAVPGIDVIVGGHTHTELKQPVLVEGTEEPVIIVQTKEYNNFLGELDVTFDDNGIISTHTGKLHKVSEATADEEATKLLAPYTAEVDLKGKESTGVSSENILNGERSSVRTGETNLGNLITDGMLYAAQQIDEDATIALQNSGGIRASIDEGDITIGEVLTTMPFGNALAIMKLSGAEILEALEHSVKDYPVASGAFLQVSGLQYMFDGKAPVGEKVINVQVNENGEWNQLEADKMYTVATNTFTAKGGDDYTTFAKAYKDGRVSEPGNIDYEMFITYIQDYIEEFETLDYETTENRVVAEIPFMDVDWLDWEFPFVQNLYYKDLIKGTTDSTFSPYSQLTRAQAASLIVRALDLENEASATFTDLGNVAQATKNEIAAANEAGIVFGQKGEFMPYKSVTRAQFALMLNRAYDYKMDPDYEVGAKADFSDFGTYDQETVDAISMLAELEIANGIDGKFMPGNPTTRAQTAKMISNFLTHLK